MFVTMGLSYAEISDQTEDNELSQKEPPGPESGLYRIIHTQHRLSKEATLIVGHSFPPSKCTVLVISN